MDGQAVGRESRGFTQNPVHLLPPPPPPSHPSSSSLCCCCSCPFAVDQPHFLFIRIFHILTEGLTGQALLALLSPCSGHFQFGFASLLIFGRNFCCFFCSSDTVDLLWLRCHFAKWTQIDCSKCLSATWPNNQSRRASLQTWRPIRDFQFPTSTPTPAIVSYSPLPVPSPFPSFIPHFQSHAMAAQSKLHLREASLHVNARRSLREINKNCPIKRNLSEFPSSLYSHTAGSRIASSRSQIASDEVQK